MQDLGYALPRKSILGTSVNRGRARREIVDRREPQRPIHHRFIAVLYAQVRMEPEGTEETFKKGETANA
jgi:hypothetical protein